MSLKMKYFVLKPEGNTLYALASRAAMETYAETVEKADPELASDLRRWIIQEANKTHQAIRKMEERKKKHDRVR